MVLISRQDKKKNVMIRMLFSETIQRMALVNVKYSDSNFGRDSDINLFSSITIVNEFKKPDPGFDH